MTSEQRVANKQLHLGNFSEGLATASSLNVTGTEISLHYVVGII